jgi:hypothetical protein
MSDTDITGKRVFANIHFTSRNGIRRRIATQRIDREAIERLRSVNGMERMADNLELLLTAVEEDRMGPGEDYPVFMSIGIQGERVQDDVAL